MFPTRLLRRVIHYIWECYRERGEIKLRLRHEQVAELQVEEDVEASTVTVRYFAQQPTGELVKQCEVVCFIQRHGEWIPLAMARGTEYHVYARTRPDTDQVEMIDRQGQQEAAAFCDRWAMELLASGFLSFAAKQQPLQVRATQRPRWPQPTMPTPSLEEIEEWVWESGGCFATDGVWVEIDGISPDGHPSWLLRLGIV